MEYNKQFYVRWADVDANNHMRHTAYNDYAAHVRVAFMIEHGLDAATMHGLQLGPVLFREETLFYRELSMNERIKVDVRLSGVSDDGERWKMVHRIFNEAGKLSAEIRVEGAWIDTRKRKLKAPPAEYVAKFSEIEKTEDFAFIEKSVKA